MTSTLPFPKLEMQFSKTRALPASIFLGVWSAELRVGSLLPVLLYPSFLEGLRSLQLVICRKMGRSTLASSNHISPD